MQSDCHSQSDCECEVMILISLSFRLDFKVQSCFVTLTSLSNTISFAYCMFIPVSVSCLIAICRLVDRHNNFYFHLFLATWNQLITLIIMNLIIYNNNTLFNIGLAKLDILIIQCTWYVELSSTISVVRDQSPD